MKLNRTILSISTLALAVGACCLGLYHVAWAKDITPGWRVDTHPVNRDAGSGNTFAPIVKRVSPSVVNIYSSRTYKQRYYTNPMMADPFFRQFFGDRMGDGKEMTRRENWLGSGVIVTPDGYILTANHVVEGADEIKVGISNDKNEYTAQVIGTDKATDIAVLKIAANNLPAITRGDSDQVEVGDTVLAIGNPFGLGQTVTRGIVSALGRSLPMEDEENPYNRVARYQDFIQTDASINKGNSGGALIDSEGRLIGVNDAIVSPSGTSAGIGFAVPINMARGVMESIVNGGKVIRGYLGIEQQDLDASLAKGFGLANSGGAIVADVMPDSPADKGGLRSGDVIVAINDREISSAEKLRNVVAQLRPGSQADIKLIRNGNPTHLKVTIGERPDTVAVGDKPKSREPDAPHNDSLDGVYVQDLDNTFRRQLQPPQGISGAVVTDVDDDSNAFTAGLRPGDIILEINHQAVTNAETAVKYCKGAKTEQILVKIWRRAGDTSVTRFLSVNNTKRGK